MFGYAKQADIDRLYDRLDSLDKAYGVMATHQRLLLDLSRSSHPEQAHLDHEKFLLWAARDARSYSYLSSKGWTRMAGDDNEFIKGNAGDKGGMIRLSDYLAGVK